MAMPCRQLNSKVIRGVTECSILPIVEKKCSVVVVKCIWRVEDNQIDNAWKWICEKRDSCDNNLKSLENVSFFFSAISTCESNATKGKKKGHAKKASQKEDDLDIGEDETAILSQGASVVSLTNKKIFPAITYWIACQTRNGAVANPFSIQSALLKCGLEVTATRTSRKSGSDALNKLCQVLKDHKNEFMEQLVTSSYRHCLSSLREKAVGGTEDDLDMSQESRAGSENVVRMGITQGSPFKTQLSVALKSLRKAGLNIDCFDLVECNDSTSSKCVDAASKPLSSPATVLCNDIALMMAKLGYAANRGDVYRKNDRAKYTYSYLCSMKTFLHSLMGNEHFKDRLVQHMSRVLPLLSDPDNCVIQQLKLLRDIVEVFSLPSSRSSH